MSNVQELLSSFASGELSGVSALKLRDENIQKKKGSKKFATLKREPKKKSKLLIITELAIPFNPFTGVEDETYNRDSKFRPTQSETTITLLVKRIAHENEEVKKIYMDRAGVEKWDTSELEKITEVDKQVVARYRVPRKFTLPVCRVNIPSFTGNAYGKEYLMKVERDELTDEIIGEIPLPLQVNKLMNDMKYEEIAELEEQIANKEIVLNDKDKESKIKTIREKVIVSGDYPLNYVLAIEIPLDTKYKYKEDTFISEATKENFMSKVVLVKCTAEIESALDKYINGEYEALDLYTDFWEYDMSCSDDQDKKDLGRNTRYEKAMVTLKDHASFNTFNKAYIEFMDETKDLEKTFMNSVFVSKFNQSMENTFLDAVKSVIDIDSKYLTSKVISANSNIISMVFGEEGDDKLAEASIGMIAEGKLDEKESRKAGKEIDLMNVIGDVDNEEEDLEDMTIE